MSKLWTLLLATTLFGCATSYHNPNLPLTDEDSYFSTLQKFTAKMQVYNGFQAAVDYSATLLNHPVSQHQVDQNARIYQWTPTQYADEKAKSESVLAKRTEIFLSFFTPDKKNDDLNKAKTSWKIFLDAGGRRYEGRAEKIKANNSEIAALYPSYNRWSTPYRLIFDTPVSQIENQQSKLTLTGPIGSTTVEFNPIETVR